MDSEISEFETSEMVATFLASTPLLRDSWRLCAATNMAAQMGYVSEQIGGVGYLAFSGVEPVESLSEASWARLVPLSDSAVFGPLVGPTDDDGLPMVHAGLLQLFLPLLQSQAFRSQALKLTKQCKSIVITGHSLGGATASLTTLWLLSQLQQLHTSSSSSASLPSVLCITFGSPMLGNEPLTRAILRERWGANFCHVVAKQDIMPRLLFAPSATLLPPMRPMLQYWHNVMSGNASPTALLGDGGNAAEFFGFVIASIEKCSSSGEFWPFGNYLLCSHEGAVCLDDAECVVKMMHLMLVSNFSPSECISDHVKYGEYVERVSLQYLKKSFSAVGERLKNSYEAGLALALHSTEIPPQEPAATLAKECLKDARRLGLTPILNCAKLSVSLSKVVPFRAEIEWYMASCDKSDEQRGYYDEFKLSGCSKRGSRVNLNRHKLAGFWDDVIHKLEKNELPYDFPKRRKYVNSFHFYKLLVEPLDIADYYRKERHLVEGHYLSNGRPRRYQISDRWWREVRNDEKENKPRTRYASQTQDSCFWARLEEAKDWLSRVQNEDGSMNLEMWENVNRFNMYARSLVEKKEVSKDVVAKNSSYTKWTEELQKLSSALVYPAPRFNSEF